jgi:hypothetical protein
MFGLVAVLAGCYHVTVDTGLAPSPTATIDQPWALGFVYGLIPPPTVTTMQRCPKGVAKVETQMDFLNGLVSSVTFGILTPWHIKVTCALDGTTHAAAGGQTIHLQGFVSPRAIQEAVQRAADVAVESGQPAYVAF